MYISFRQFTNLTLLQFLAPCFRDTLPNINPSDQSSTSGLYIILSTQTAKPLKVKFVKFTQLYGNCHLYSCNRSFQTASLRAFAIAFVPLYFNLQTCTIMLILIVGFNFFPYDYYDQSVQMTHNWLSCTQTSPSYHQQPPPLGSKAAFQELLLLLINIAAIYVHKYHYCMMWKSFEVVQIN